MTRETFGTDIICSFEENCMMWEKIKFADNAVSPVHVPTGVVTCQVMLGQFEVNDEEATSIKECNTLSLTFCGFNKKAVILKHIRG